MKDADETSATLQLIDGPYLDLNETATTLTPGGTSGSVTVTASSTTGINNDTGFQTTDVGRLIRFKDSGGDWHYMEITARSSTTNVTATIVDTTLASTSAATDWRLGAWSETTGFPHKCLFYNSRLLFGRTGGTIDARPDTVWGTESNDYINFTPGTNATDPITITINSAEINPITWLEVTKRAIRVGTIGNVLDAVGPSDTLISPTNPPVIDNLSRVRCANISPIPIDNGLLFLDSTKTALNLLQYNIDVDAPTPTELSLLSEHITYDGVRQMDIARRSDQVNWLVEKSKYLIGNTLNIRQQLNGWHKHVLGGSDSKFISCGVLPTSNRNDRVWVVASRTIDNTTKKYVEYLSETYTTDDVTTNTKDIPETCVYSDSHVSFSGEKPDATLTPAAVTGLSITFTAGSSVFSSSDVGRLIRS